MDDTLLRTPAELRTAPPVASQDVPDTAPCASRRPTREAYARGLQLAEMRKLAGVTQADLAAALGVSQARISKMEHGEVVGIDVVDAYVTALGGTMDIIVTFADRSWDMA